MDGIQTGAAPVTTITPINQPDSRGDRGIRTRRKKELGMAQDKNERHSESSAGQILLEQLYKDGWGALASFSRTMHRNGNKTSKFFCEVKKRAEANGLENGICEFMRGSLNHTMLSPALMEVCQEHFPAPQVLLPMQAGERVSSLIQDEFFTHLIHAIKKQMEQEKISLEYALVTRKKRAKNPTCLTVEFQSVLQEMGIITFRSENVNRLIRIHSKKIPRGPKDMENKAKEICTRLREKIAEKEEAAPSNTAGKVIDAARPPDIGYDGRGLA